MVYPALLPLMRTPRLPAVDRTDASDDLNGLVRFGERRVLVSARVPSRFNWPLLRNILLLVSSKNGTQFCVSLFTLSGFILLKDTPNV